MAPGTKTAPPKYKYEHLSTVDPAFEAIRAPIEEGIKQLFSLPLDQIRPALLAPPALPEDIAQDLIITEDSVAVRDGTKIGIKIYKSKSVAKNAGLFFCMHGGGWAVGSHGVEEITNRYVAADGKAIVVSVDYRLAPEFKYPYAVNDSFDVLKWCKANASKLGINPEQIIVGGSSAGGNLAAALAQKTRDEGVSGVIGQILNIPVTCHPKFFPKEKYEYRSWEQNKDAPMLDAKTMKWFWDQYVPNPHAEPYASPLLAESLKGLPPALVQVAGLDPLRDEGLAYAEALKAAGVPVRLEVYPGMPHGFGSLVPLKASVVKYNGAAADWVRQRVTQTTSNL